MADALLIQEDARVKRTRRAIQSALIDLTVEQGYPTITVQDMVTRAQINRSTFYRHYLDKEDVLVKYMDEVIGVCFRDDPVSEGQTDSPNGLVKLFHHIQTVSAFYRIMLSANGHPMVSDRLRRKIEKHLREKLREVGDTSPHTLVDMKLNYMSGAGIGAILWWVENDASFSAETLAKWIGELSSAGLGVTFPPSKPSSNS